MLSYWTIPYVSIEDRRLVFIYNVLLLGVLSSLFVNVFVSRMYLEPASLDGVARVKVLSPPNLQRYMQEQSGGQPPSGGAAIEQCADHVPDDLDSDAPPTAQDAFAEEDSDEPTKHEARRACVAMDADELVSFHGPGEFFVLTRVKDVLQEREMICNHPPCKKFKKLEKRNYFPVEVGNFTLSVVAVAEAGSRGVGGFILKM